MTTRNVNFPLEQDFRIGGMWLSGIMERFSTTLEHQLRMVDAFTKICHSYYKKFLDVNNDLFLNKHDLDNICSLWNAVHPYATYHFGIPHVFYFYSRVVADLGSSPSGSEVDDILFRHMNALHLTASKHLDDDHPYYQEGHA